METLALALLIGLVAIAFAIFRVAHALNEIRLANIAIAAEAIKSYNAAHVPLSPPPDTVDPRGPKGK
jgi:hypothetical protein